jgi:hypothetical protein
MNTEKYPLSKASASAGFTIFLALSIALNPLVVGMYVPVQDLAKIQDLLWLVSIMNAGLAGIFLAKRQPLLQLWKSSALVNVWVFVFLVGIVLCTNRIWAMQFRWLRVLIYLALILQMLKSYYLLVVKPEAKGWRMRIPTIFLPLFLLFLLSEIGFMFVAKSHGSYPDSLAQINWNLRYWDVNEDGYRDKPFSRRGNKKAVMVIGDSFTAGSGVKDPADRFSDKLESNPAFNDKAVFWNLGQPGSNTPHEFIRIKESGLDPDVILISYCLNDIHDAAKQAGVELEWNPAGSGIPSVLIPLMHYSHTFNYFFGIYGMGFTQMDYYSWLEGCFTNPDVLKYHYADMDQILEYARERNIKMAAIVFPLMQAPEPSVKITGIVSDYFRSRNVPVVDLGPELSPYPPDSLWVRPLDPHPNEFVNARAAVALEKLFLENKILQ